MEKQVWYDAMGITRNGLILDLRGQKNYRFVLRLIKTGKLKSKMEDGKRIVHIDWINEYNSSENH